MFMACTSDGSIFEPRQIPQIFFSREYINKKFVTYNLKYDSGALLQHLPFKNLKELQKTDETIYNDFKYKVISNKFMSISYKKNSIQIYDMLNFYDMSLNAAAKKFLGKQKLDIETKTFTPEYVVKNWYNIAQYCIQDAVLVQELAQLIIKQFEGFGVFPKKLYSVAYASGEYFKKRCAWIHVKKLWYKNQDVLQFAIDSYNGGKFEVTRKGTDYYYEYDIVSAYPYEISNLVDTRNARINYKRKYQKDAIYGFIDCTMNIPQGLNSPIAVKRKSTCCYPYGVIRKVITKNEYEYLINNGADITIHKAYWLMVDKIIKPYKEAIEELMIYKDKYKREDKKAEYHTVKIFLNSFYGKFWQLIEKDGLFKAGSLWHPLYASIITSNCRIRISELQLKYKNIVAVHTDSVMSTIPLPFPKDGVLGDLTYSTEGQGLILGCGVYQIGKKSRIRGFDTQTPLMDMIPKRGKVINMEKVSPYTWREIAHHSMDKSLINRFENQLKELRLNFDTKRIWLHDYKDYSEVLNRQVYSLPYPSNLL